jgi:hypothetical protein
VAIQPFELTQRPLAALLLPTINVRCKEESPDFLLYRNAMIGCAPLDGGFNRVIDVVDCYRAHEITLLTLCV